MMRAIRFAVKLGFLPFSFEIFLNAPVRYIEPETKLMMLLQFSFEIFELKEQLLTAYEKYPSILF